MLITQIDKTHFHSFILSLSVLLVLDGLDLIIEGFSLLPLFLCFLFPPPLMYYDEMLKFCRVIRFYLYIFSCCS